MKRMDKIGDSGQTYKKTGLTTIVILIALIQIYVSISAGDVLWQFLIIQNETLRAVVKGLLDCFVFSILYGILYFLVDLFYRTLWIYRNKRIFIQGKWLHIHKKDPIRIGVVDIKQEFENIYATAENIAPEGQQEKAYQVTSWKYMMATVHADSSTVRDVIGCYTATKKDSNISNDGMHMLNITAEEGYPIRMDGRFSDTFRVSETEIDPSNRCGQLFMFKMSKRVKKYLYGPNGLDYDKLRTLHNNEEFSDEPYVRMLKMLLSLNVHEKKAG